MTNIRLPLPGEECKQVVETAFERTDAIDEYHDGGTYVIGLSGSRVRNSAEWVHVEIPEPQPTGDETWVTVPPGDDLSVTTTTQSRSARAELLRNLDDLRMEVAELDPVESDL